MQVATGNTFTLFLTDAGQVYAAGSSEHGQLGNGSTSELKRRSHQCRANSPGERIVKGNKLAWDVQTPPRKFLDVTLLTSKGKSRLLWRTRRLSRLQPEASILWPSTIMEMSTHGATPVMLA